MMTQQSRTELSVAAFMLSVVCAVLLLISARAAAMHVQSGESVITPVVAAPATP